MANADNSPKRGKIEIIKKHVHSYSDFPKPGVLFRDIFGVLQSPEAFSALKDLLIEEARRVEPAVQCVVGLESRGFLFGPSIALDLQVPFVPIRKKGKLPGQVFSHSYLLEYGEDTIEIQGSAIKKGQSVLIVDDLLATGGSLKASCELIKTIGSTVASCLVVIELESLNGRANISAPIRREKWFCKLLTGRPCLF
ncbi:adenine phosphoribosyltransferase isoform X1 [Cylas formicarius]|nr:adenine phosphoribosyltransferase isoform X1 [Cylas formicarius]